ncbi:MAG: hypothetical protein GF364_05840 [Candidatus Lokiarchaeota archaeon]|nr:hypothetical protein [Candidatus Lokiarchaeota archaeon]
MIEILIWIFLFFLGYLTIYFSADKLIDSLEDLSEKTNVSPFLMGLLVIGIDPEETIASIIASINNLPFIAIGNVVGNSIISFSLCFALPAIFYSLKYEKINKFYNYILVLGTLIIGLGLVLDKGLLITGIINLGIFFIYLYRTILNSRNNNLGEKQMHQKKEKHNIGGDIIKVIIFLILVLIGGEILIFSANKLIILTPIQETFFGFVVIAFLTNVEEITLIIKAIKKEQTDIGMGGMIGKIIWNIGLTYGISAIISISVTISVVSIYNTLILLILVCYSFYLNKKSEINRLDGSILLIIFVLFLILNLSLF